MASEIHCVNGNLDPSQLGKTMTHEHLLWDQIVWWGGDPEELSLRAAIHQPISMEMLGQVFYQPHRYLDNIQQFDVDLAISEAAYLKKAGCSSLVDVTSLGLGRDPMALAAISSATGLNIIMGSGYYQSSLMPAEMQTWSKEQHAAQIVDEFENGVKYTGIRPGVIGEIGMNDLNDPRDINRLKAAGLAQKTTGAPLYIHPIMLEQKDHQILDILESEGTDLTKVVLCHCDPTLMYPDYHHSLAQRGAYIEYDQFGLEFIVADWIWLPRDIDRIHAICKQIEMGGLERILVSQDVAFKTSLVKYGGGGYGHILRDLVPHMRHAGITEKQLQTIMVENPARLLGF
jgi:phosphotriesterase-related protein